MGLAVLTSDDERLDETPGMPMWWLRRLHAVILQRRGGLARIRRYHKGDFEWRYADAKLRKAFGPVFYSHRFGVNWMKLVVSSQEERLKIDGIRVGESPDGDPDVWDMWTKAKLPARSPRVHRLALLYGTSYVTVWPGAGKTPVFKIDHPSQAAVEVDPDDELQRLAGLRTFIDIRGFMHAQLFLPDSVYLYVSGGPVTDATMREATDMTWAIDDADIPDGVMSNPLGVVPIVPFVNDAAAEWPGEEDGRYLEQRSELYNVMPIQDTINSVMMNAILVANQQGFRQRYVTGLEIERDEHGKPIKPFEPGMDRIWQTNNPNAKFGEFTPGSVADLLSFIEQLVRNIASVSQVPPHMLEAQADRLSADSIRAAESGLISKIHTKQTIFGGGWGEVVKLGLTILREAKDAEAQIIWKNPETNTLAALNDAALKMVATGVPWRGRMEFLGYTPQEIDRFQKQREDDAKLTQPAIDSAATVLATEPVDPNAPKPPAPNSLPAPVGQ